MLKTAVGYIDTSTTTDRIAEGDLLMDAPETDSWEELVAMWLCIVALGANRTGWRAQTRKLKLSAKHKTQDAKYEGSNDSHINAGRDVHPRRHPYNL